MPFLRVLRDKCGYETTYLMHWFRDGNRQRSRILYMFRTPPGVRVGCDPLEPAVVREIEAQNPDIEFDWRALFENRQVVESAPEPRHQRQPKAQNRAEPAEARKRSRENEEGQSAVVVEQTEVPPSPAPAPSTSDPTTAPRFRVPMTIEGSTREEQLAFLSRWYPEVRDRIPHRTQDPLRRDALLTLAERLNPAAWQDEEQIAAGLQHAAEALHRLSRVFSKRRRRPRRSKPAASESPPATNESS